MGEGRGGGREKGGKQEVPPFQLCFCLEWRDILKMSRWGESYGDAGNTEGMIVVTYLLAVTLLTWYCIFLLLTTFRGAYEAFDLTFIGAHPKMTIAAVHNGLVQHSKTSLSFADRSIQRQIWNLTAAWEPPTVTWRGNSRTCFLPGTKPTFHRRSYALQ